MEAGIDRDDVRAIMLSLLYLHLKVDDILDLLEGDGEEEEETDA